MHPGDRSQRSHLAPPPIGVAEGWPTKDIWFWEHRVPEGQKAYSMTKPIRFEHLQGCIDWWGGAKRKGREETPQAWKVTAKEVKARGYNLDIKNPHSVANDYGDPDELLLARIQAAMPCSSISESVRSTDHSGGKSSGGPWPTWRTAWCIRRTGRPVTRRTVTAVPQWPQDHRMSASLSIE